MVPAALGGDRVEVVRRGGRRGLVEVARVVQVARPPAAAAADPAAGDGGERGPREGQGAQGAAHRRRDGHCNRQIRSGRARGREEEAATWGGHESRGFEVGGLKAVTATNTEDWNP